MNRQIKKDAGNRLIKSNMSLIENHKGTHLTFDNRTFTECSQRMQRITTTLPRNSDAVSEVSSESDQDINTNSMIIPSSPYLPSRVTGGRPGPIPPPRRNRKPVSPLSAESIASNSKDSGNPNGLKNYSRGSVSEENSRNRDQIDLSTNAGIDKGFGDPKDKDSEDQGVQTLKGPGSKLIPILKRPIQQFLHWMSDIANNVEIHSCPP